MKMRRHRVFLLCTVGLCVISFLHYYKALHYVSLLRELSAPYPNIKSFIMVSGFFWRKSPLSSASPEERPLPALRPSDTRAPSLETERFREVGTDRSAKPKAPQPWLDPDAEEHNEIKPVVRNTTTLVHLPDQRGKEDLSNMIEPKLDPKLPSTRDPMQYLGDLHKRFFNLKEDTKRYFVSTQAGAWCFLQGTKMVSSKEDSVLGKNKTLARGVPQRNLLQAIEPPNNRSRDVVNLNPIKKKGKNGKRLVKCVCRPGWHGPYCGVPTMVHHSNLPTKDRLIPRRRPRRVINAININHEFDLLHARFRELADAVDVFLVCESNFTAYGEKRSLLFLPKLLNGTYDYIRHKILYVFLNHFPDGGRQDGWIADDYLRTYLTRNGIPRILGLRHDDVFLINDADEIPARDGVLFLKLFDGWTEPFAIHMRKSLYGFFWKQLGSLEVVSGCTVKMLNEVYENDGIRLRRREYYTMPNFRKYENDTGHILVQWSIGSPFHFAGWHCSWCFPPEGIHFKLISAQNGDFPRWGDYEEKRDLNYIRKLIQTGGWFDGSVQEYPPSDPKEHMYAPKYIMDNYKLFHYLLENPYTKQQSQNMVE